MESAFRAFAVYQAQIRGDAEFGEVDALDGLPDFSIVDVEFGGCFQTGADVFGGAFDFQRAGDDAADAAILVKAGYTLGKITLVDQFIHSPHVELACLMTLKRK
jgi:hypothetical protein